MAEAQDNEDGRRPLLTAEPNRPPEAPPTRRTGVWIAGKLPAWVVSRRILWAAVPTLILIGFAREPILQAIRGESAQFDFQLWLYAFLIALTNNVDNLGARIAYSMQGTRVSNAVNLWISVITFVISFVAAASGAAAIGYFGEITASVLAMGFLVALGSWMIFQARKPAWREEQPLTKDQASLWTILLKPHQADVDRSRHIDFKEGTVLGIALSINNVGGGLSAGIIGVDPFLVALLSALVSFVALWAGNYMAEFFVKRNIAEKAAAVGGALLIVTGIKQLF
jgi:putative sporulation protein YtaF